MRVIEINHHDPAGAPPSADVLTREVGHLRVQGAGVVITLIQRPGEGIDVTVNPSGEPYMHNVKTHEVYASSSQVRVTGAKGSPL